ncbi:MAG TPA: hypothetical protein VK588_01820 [Chitinophagaceae bacterium]|nr:hypothetical protein [Chitinophagaceae bacterium]
MAKKTKEQSPKSSKKALLKEIEIKLADTVKDFHKKSSEKKLGRQIHKAGKILAKSLTNKEHIKVVHKEKVKAPKKDKKVAEKEVAS